MKLDFTEGEFASIIELKPETAKEFAQLLRTARNSKAVKPLVRFSFYGDEPYLEIYLEKVKRSVQVTHVNNQR